MIRSGLAWKCPWTRPLTAKRCRRVARSIEGRETNLVRRIWKGSVEPFPTTGATYTAAARFRGARVDRTAVAERAPQRRRSCNSQGDAPALRAAIIFSGSTYAPIGRAAPEELIAAAHAGCFSMALCSHAGCGRTHAGEDPHHGEGAFRPCAGRLCELSNRALDRRLRARHRCGNLREDGDGSQGKLPCLTSAEGSQNYAYRPARLGNLAGALIFERNGEPTAVLTLQELHAGENRRVQWASSSR
jgi:hypothetical protein